MRCVCSLGVEVQVEHKKLMWVLPRGLYTYPVCLAVRKQCQEQAQGHSAMRRLQQGKAGSWKVLQSGWQEAKGGGNVDGPRGGLSGMQSKDLVGRRKGTEPTSAVKLVNMLLFPLAVLQQSN